MAGGKQTPRQRLINLMYLVLTAMLALQVSSSIMDKFIFLNQSLEHSMTGAQQASENALEQLKKKVEKEGNSPEGLRSIKRAEELKRETDKVFKEIEKLKREIQNHPRAGAGIDPHTGTVKNAKEETGVEVIMIGTNRNGKGYQLEKDLNQYVEYLNKQFVEDKALGFAGPFEGIAKGNKDVIMYANDPLQRGKDFANANFGQTPVVAALAILTQRQSEIVRYEQEVLKKLGAGDLSQALKFDKIIASASADANVVAAGQDYTAQLFITATSTKSGARMAYNGSPITVNSDGEGKVSFVANTVGKSSWTGTVTISQRGKDTTFTVKKEYEVVQPVLIVTASSKFPLYRNCANSLETSVPALGPAYRPAFSVDNGTFVPGARMGDVTLFPGAGATCKLSVSSGGKNVGLVEFRVNPVPPPSVFLANSAGGPINITNALPPVQGLNVVAKPDETFLNTLPKEAVYRVTGLTYTLFRGGKSAGSLKSSNGSINLDALKTRAGDGVMILIDGVQRINSRGQIEEVKLLQNTISFFVK